MRRVGVCAAGLVLLLTGVVAAEEPLLQCGTYVTRAQEMAFLHLRSMIHRARAGLDDGAISAQGAAVIQQDVGEIAVLDASGGVASPLNPFDLANQTVTLRTGTSGYTVQVSGATFDSAASTAGTRLNLGDNDTTLVSLPFAFHFYGGTYSEAWVNSNGTVTFTEGDLDASGSFGHFTTGPPAIAGLFADLNPAASASGVRVFTEPARIVLTWSSVALVNSSTTNSFQIRLYPDDHIELAYGSANPSHAIAGVTPGNEQPVSLVNFSGGPVDSFPNGVAESFRQTVDVDLIAAAQRFYTTHDDAYDYLLFYNAMGIPAASGVVSFEMTTRSVAQGIGDTAVDIGVQYGSARRLKAVLNMGPLSQYPVNPNGIVASRGTFQDTPVTLLAHESGHLFLALLSVPSPVGANPPPMLTSDRAHWAFTFNSDASVMGGNRISDGGTGTNPEFHTTGTVQHYSAVDQYLMGLRPPDQVPATFAVLSSGISNSRASQTGVNFNGSRLNIGVNDIIAAGGRRTPDATVAQRDYHFAFVVIVPEGADAAAIANAVSQVDGYRATFETFFANGTDLTATATTTLRRNVLLSIEPAAGVVVAHSMTASIELPSPAAAPLTFTLQVPSGVLDVPGSVTIPAGAHRVSFTVFGNRVGVEEFAAVPDNMAYHTARARVQVNLFSSLHLEIVSGNSQVAGLGPLPDPVVIRVTDQNKLPYPGVAVAALPTAGGSVNGPLVTDDSGQVSFQWTPALSSTNTLSVSLVEAPSVAVAAQALGLPVVLPLGVVNAASYTQVIPAGGFASIFGTHLAGGASGSSSLPFPMNFLGVQVTVNGALAQLTYVSDGQINFLAPANLLPGSATLSVRTPVGSSPAVTIQVAARSPGIFWDVPSGYGAILIAGTINTTQVSPAQTGDFLEIYCNGLGATPQAGVTIAGIPVEVTYAGPSYLGGLDQVNVKIPAGLPSGPQDLILTVNTLVSNTVKVQIAAGP